MIHSATVANWALHYHQDRPFLELKADSTALDFYLLFKATPLAVLIPTILYFRHHAAPLFLCFGPGATQYRLFLLFLLVN